MQRYERLNAVLELLAARGRLSVDEIVETFDVSAATVRRDLDDLDAQQLITRTRGGAVLQSVSYDLPLRYKSVRQPDEKSRIAQAAAALVEPGAVVGLNGGTTTTAVARVLATRADHGGFTIVTNALNIAGELIVRPQVKTVVVGGVALAQSYELVGPLASRVLSEISIATLFLGVNSFSATAGAAAHHEGEAEVNRLMVEAAQRVIVVADGSKIGQSAFARICGTDQVDLLVTDDTAPATELDALRDAGLEIVIA